MNFLNIAIVLTVVIFISAFIVAAVLRKGHHNQSATRSGTSILETEIEKQRTIVDTRFNRRMDQFDRGRSDAMQAYLDRNNNDDER